MMFDDRFHAGSVLASYLSHYCGRDCAVLAIPRGGVQVGYMVAKALDAPLEPVLVKKIGHPLNPEYAIGTVAPDNVTLHLPPDVDKAYVDKEIHRIRRRLDELKTLYLDGRHPLNLHGKIVILVDDGIATGSTVSAAIPVIRRQKPSRIVIGVPAGARAAVDRLLREADEVVCLCAPEDFESVGEFYRDFAQVEDGEVVKLLSEIAGANHDSVSAGLTGGVT